MPDVLTRDRALMALNDRCGREVEVTVDVKTELGPSVMSAKGILRHWRDDDHALELWAEFTRDDVTGLYDVGDSGASFDVTGLARAELLVEDGEPYGLAFDLNDGAVLNVVWGVNAD